MMPPFNVVLDIDETLLNPLDLYRRKINAEVKGGITVEDIVFAGGLDALFEFHPRRVEMMAIVERLRADVGFNSDIPVLDNSVHGVKRLLSLPNIFLGAYLTTRPESVKAVTEADLHIKGFPPG